MFLKELFYKERAIIRDKIRPCLYAARHYDVKKLIRAGAGDRELRDLFEKIIKEKGRFTKLNSFTEAFSMFSIGG